MRTESYDAVVIGGGLSGLGVAGMLGKAGKKVVLLERGGTLGGRAQSIEMDGYTLDLGPHVIQGQGFQEQMTDVLGKGDELRKLRAPLIEGDIKVATFRDGGWINFNDVVPSGPEMEKVGMAIQSVTPEEMPKYDSISVADWIRGITDNKDVIFFVNFLDEIILQQIIFKVFNHFKILNQSSIL